MTPKTSRSLLAGTAIAALAVASLGLAAAAEMVGMQAGKTADEIRASLTAQGYEVRKVKPEDGKLEAYALKDGKLYEIYVDPATGAVTAVKEQD